MHVSGKEWRTWETNVKTPFHITIISLSVFTEFLMHCVSSGEENSTPKTQKRRIENIKYVGTFAPSYPHLLVTVRLEFEREAESEGYLS